MQRYNDATPCPAPFLAFPRPAPYYNNLHALTKPANAYMYDDTSNVEYTTELQAHLRNVKPRRRPNTQRKSTWNPLGDIYEDGQQNSKTEPVQDGRHLTAAQDFKLRRSTILAQPAQKLLITAPSTDESQNARPRRRRVSAILADREGNITEDTGERESPRERAYQHTQDKHYKDARRRTIYVPSEDTTIMTIHPGAPTHKYRAGRPRSPDLGLDLVTFSEEEIEELIPIIRQKKPPRKSLAAAPKRAPLRQSIRPLQSVSFGEDVMGTGGGKENIPPGKVVEEVSCKAKDIQSVDSEKPTKDDELGKVRNRTQRLGVVEPTTASQARTTTRRKRTVSGGLHDSCPIKLLKAKANVTATGSDLRSSLKVPHSQPSLRNPPLAPSPPAHLRRRSEAAPAKLSVPLIFQRAKEHQEKYPVLSEDLSRPGLFEDHWLSYQEVAITQLLNGLFESASEKRCTFNQESDSLRRKLLELYQESAIPLLHKRLQASLLYGALSIPKDLLAQSLHLKDDLGLRRKFLNLWLETYDLDVLKAAAEVVVGREAPVSARLSNGSTSPQYQERRHKAEKRAIEGFLNAFLVRNDDAVKIRSGPGSIVSIARGKDHREDEFGSHSWSWRRTVLRSLMLILLLDKAKASGIVSHCLFQVSSTHKSSTSVLHALSILLLPSLGDVTRPLGHLDFHVQVVQYPLQEYTYHVENLATDLRDGIILTRLVELLLYPPSYLASLNEESFTITMPTGELLTSTFDLNQKETWVLSQHLRLPCIGRAQKVHNVQLALSALKDVRGIAGRITSETKAEDIVDGHREKTLGMLWGLVGRCGLSTLVDWKEMEKEVRRSRDIWCHQNPGDDGDLTDSEEDSASLDEYERHVHLLRSWARNIGRLQGVRVTNLTTSFTDGKALEAIVDAYLPYFTSSSSPSTASTSSSTLGVKLKAIGCSAAFISLFTPSQSPSGTVSNHHPIPSRDFTLSALAFLASRLLPASHTHRAAATIQRTYRQRLARREVSKRVTLMRVAAHCATVVRTRERVVGAAVVLQRAWRQVLDRRIAALVKDVMEFQCVARGWAARRRVAGSGKRRERVRGGW